MSVMAYQIPDNWTFCSKLAQTNNKVNIKAPHRSPFPRGIHRWPVDSAHKRPGQHFHVLIKVLHLFRLLRPLFHWLVPLNIHWGRKKWHTFGRSHFQIHVVKMKCFCFVSDLIGGSSKIRVIANPFQCDIVFFFISSVFILSGYKFR